MGGVRKRFEWVDLKGVQIEKKIFTRYSEIQGRFNSIRTKSEIFRTSGVYKVKRPKRQMEAVEFK